jgi:hypothetical protein
VHDAVLFAVRHGKNEDYLSANSVFEAEQTSRITYDSEMAVSQVCETFYLHFLELIIERVLSRALRSCKTHWSEL